MSTFQQTANAFETVYSFTSYWLTDLAQISFREVIKSDLHGTSLMYGFLRQQKTNTQLQRKGENEAIKDQTGEKLRFCSLGIGVNFWKDHAQFTTLKVEQLEKKKKSKAKRKKKQVWSRKRKRTVAVRAPSRWMENPVQRWTFPPEHKRHRLKTSSRKYPLLASGAHFVLLLIKKFSFFFLCGNSRANL